MKSKYYFIYFEFNQSLFALDDIILKLMKEHIYNVKSCEDTGKFMYQLVKRYSSDIGDYANYSLDDFFNVIKKIPYKKEKIQLGLKDLLILIFLITPQPATVAP